MSYNVEVIETVNKIEISSSINDQEPRIEILQNASPTIAISNTLALLPSDFNDNVKDTIESFLVSGYGVSIVPSGSFLLVSASGLQPSGNYSLVGHSHSSSDVTNFSSSVSGLLPVKNILSGSGINIINANGDFTIAVTGQFGLTAEQVDDRVSSLLVPGDYINLNYNDSADFLTISVTGVQPSGNYSLVGHLHNISDVNELQIVLDNKQPSGNYSIIGHSHIISDISGLQSSLDAKQPSGNYANFTHSHTSSHITDFNTSVSGLLIPYATINSPSFSGIPTAPTAQSGTNNTQIANTQFVRTEISNLVNTAPTTLDTLNELAIALGNDPNFATTISNSLGQKANLSGANFTGSISAPSGNFTLLQQNGVNVSVSGHSHSSSNIIDFNNSVSGILPVTNILGGTNISVIPSGSIYTINVSGQLGLTQEEVDDRISSLLIPGSGIVLNYNDNSNILTISTTGLQPSGSYANAVHAHNYSDITNFASGVADSLTTTLLAGSFINIDYNSALDTLTISTSGLQPSGNYSVEGHSHTASNITDFSGAVSGLLPIKNIIAGTNIGIVSSNNEYTISVSGQLGLTSEEVDDRVSNLLVAGSGINLNYNDSLNILTVSTTGLQPSGDYSIIGHTHNSSNIIDFNSSVSGLLPVTNILSGTGISVSNSSGVYTIEATGSGILSDQAKALVTTVFNKTGSSIPKMTAVYINGGQGDLPTVSLAIATSDMTSAGTYGLTYETISNMTSGKVIVFGALTGLNTDQFNPSAPQGNVNGQILYLSPTVSGALTLDKPSAPNHIVAIGSIVRTHQNEGIIEVRIQNGFELEELHNVAISGATSGQFLQYNGSGLWVPSSSGNFDTLLVNDINVSVSGHSHLSSNISDFNTSVSGLIPVTKIIGGSNISVSQSGTEYTVAVTGSLGLTTEEVDDRVATLLVAGTGIDLTYNDSSNTLVITSVGSSPSGNYSLVGHTHTSSSITDFNSSVSGLLPTIANSGDNRVLTSTGTSTGLNAENNLTFDGSLLNITGSGSFSNNIIASGFVRAGGTNIQFLKADGSVDNNSYYLNSNPSGYTNNTGTVTSVSALTIGTVGTDISSTVADSSTSPAITLNIPSASASNRGVLTSADWTTFNNKQNALTNPITGTGTSDYLSRFNATSGLTNSIVFESGNRIGINTVSPSGQLHVVGSGLIASVTGTVPNHLFHLYSAVSGDNIFNVEGTNGSLFSVIDSLSGTLMSVNNNAGLPVFEVFSDDRVIAGRFNQNDLVVNTSGNIGMGTSSPTEKLEVIGNIKANNIIHPFLLGGM